MDDETAELESDISELANEFQRASDEMSSIPAARHLRRARKLVEAGWNRRCFTCENRTERGFIDKEGL